MAKKKKARRMKAPRSIRAASAAAGGELFLLPPHSPSAPVAEQEEFLKTYVAAHEKYASALQFDAEAAADLLGRTRKEMEEGTSVQKEAARRRIIMLQSTQMDLSHAAARERKRAVVAVVQMEADLRQARVREGKAEAVRVKEKKPARKKKGKKASSFDLVLELTALKEPPRLASGKKWEEYHQERGKIQVRYAAALNVEAKAADRAFKRAEKAEQKESTPGTRARLRSSRLQAKRKHEGVVSAEYKVAEHARFFGAVPVKAAEKKAAKRKKGRKKPAKKKKKAAKKKRTFLEVVEAKLAGGESLTKPEKQFAALLKLTEKKKRK